MKDRHSITVTIALMMMGVALLPVVFVQQASEKRRLQAAARRTTCVACGCLLTDDSLTHAQTLWVAHLQRENPTTLFRVVRPSNAFCIACGQEYVWQGEARVFAPVQSAKLSD